MTPRTLDRLQRPLRDLRLSVTDRCNLRCSYCMPHVPGAEPIRFLPRSELLHFEEIARLVRRFVELGVRKLRITGGEPLLRRQLPELVAMLRGIPGVEDLALTTNGLLLPRLAEALKEAGLDRLTVSLDSLDERTFGEITGQIATVRAVLEGIEAAERAGFHPIKINTVVMKGVNDGEILDIARRFRERGHVPRFIEFMDAGNRNGWRLERVLPAAEIVRRIDAEMPLEALPPRHPGEVAQRFRYRGGEEEVGVISSVTSPFCQGCSRARISARGELFTCLFAERGFDLRAPLRGGAADDELRRLIRDLWQAREDRYSEERSSRTEDLPRKVEMSYIGG